MKLGVTMYSFNKYFRQGKIDIEGFIDFCGELDVQGVDLLAYYWKDKDKELEMTPKLLEDNGLELAAYAVGNNFLLKDEKERAKQIDYVKEGIDTAAALKAPVMRVFGGHLRGEGAEGISKEDGMKIIIDSFGPCVEYAQVNNIILAIENHGGIPGTSDEVIEVIKGVGSPFIKSTIDIGNFLDLGQDPVEATADLAPYAAHFHIKDYKKFPKGSGKGKDAFRGDYSLQGCIIGEGVVDLEGGFREMKESEYKGFLSIEFEGPEDDAEGVRKSAQFSKKILEKIGG